MRTFIAKFITFLLPLTIALAIAAPSTFAEETAISCNGTGILQVPTVAQLMGAEDSSFILTEIYEPIGDFKQKIKAGDLIVSQVFWKFTCSTSDPYGWSEENPEKKATEDGEPVTISGYIPYWNAATNELGACPTDYDKCSIVQVIIGQSGTAILKTYIAIIYRWAAGIVGIIAVLVIVISGIQISADQGSGENLSSAKTRIGQAIAGLVILFLSSLILYTINPTFFN
jgi:hypothetical protein